MGVPRRFLVHHQQRRQPQLEDGRRVDARAEPAGPDRAIRSGPGRSAPISCSIPSNPATIASLQKPTQFTASLPPVAQHLQTNLFQTYLQDAWRPASSLTVNLGVRYDLEYGSFNQDMNLAAVSRNRCRSSIPARAATTTTSSLARGFAWNLNQSGSSVVRGAWGFYNAVLYNGSFGTELSNLLQSNIIIRNPSYPNPYGSTVPAAVRIDGAAEHHHLQRRHSQPVCVHRDDRVLPAAGQESGSSRRRCLRACDGRLAGGRTSTRRIRSPGFARCRVWGQINQISPLGEEKYRALFVRLDRAYANRVQYLVSYTLASCMDNNTTTHRCQ